MKRTLITIALTTVVVLTLVGLASSAILSPSRTAISSLNRGFGGGGGEPEYYAEPSVVEMPAQPMMDVAQSAEEVSNSASAVDVNRLIIKNADLAIVVPDPSADMARISKLADELGGYVVSSNLSQSYYGPNSIEVPEVSLVIRVPVERLDEALAKIKETAVKVNYETTNSMDVTSEYVDLQSRLSAKQAAEKKLLEILEDAKATKDVLAVYTELQMIQTEIESLKGQIKYYEQSAALSSISIRLIAQEGTQPITIDPWRPEGAVKQALENLAYFFQNFVDFLINFVIFVLPALILIAIPLLLAFLGGRALFRRFRTPKVNVEEKVEEKK
ncbi:MAG TPA: DUF4349 domain-containing protein [Anaerolineales bacterium]|nr:DUF4349 domain-containing protein [Anaerolineales bacterium]